MDLSIKYRPTDLKDVVGQEDVTESLEASLERQIGHTFLFSGPSGTGKTTLARILAARLGVQPKNILEVDAATYTGIDAMRDITKSLRYLGFGESPRKFVILDEAHSLSKSAWDSLLKIVEEPPDHLFWSFCTTEIGKVPATIQTRCMCYTLAPIGDDVLFKLLRRVAKQEGLGAIPEDVVYLAAEGAGGSARRALKRLSAVLHCETAADAALVLREVLEADANVAEFCQAILKNAKWESLVKIVAGLGKVNSESVRQQVVAWFTKLALDTKDERKAAKLLNVLSAFAEPYPPASCVYPLLMSVGKVVFDADE